jgi:hypothetical protein
MPSSSKVPRVNRKHKAEECFTLSTYREKSFDKLMEDFEKRCAYSMVHVDATSEHNMEVDHRDPTIRGKKLHAYGNLYPAFSLCNNSKSGVWPTKNDLKERRRYLDCCKEQDYGNHLFEDVASGEILTVSKEGVFHVENLDLNNDWLKTRRRERTEDKKILETMKALAPQVSGELRREAERDIATLTERLKKAIPEIAPLPYGGIAL